MNKNCKIEIKFTAWSTEEVILKLAEYVNDGFRVLSVNYSAYYSRCGDREVTVELIKYE